MKAARRKARPKLQLHQGAPELHGEASTVASEEAHEVYVIQTVSLGDVTRLVLLHGDPLQPFRERPGIATVEVARGHQPEDNTRALIDDLIAVLQAHGRKHWELELATRELLRRAHLEVMR